MTHLTETGKLLDDAYDPTNTQSTTYLTGAFFPSIDGSSFVPYAYWGRDGRQVDLDGYDPCSRAGYRGARSSVKV